MNYNDVKRINISRFYPQALLKDTINPVLLIEESNHDALDPLRINKGDVIYTIPFPHGVYITERGTKNEREFTSKFNSLKCPGSSYLSYYHRGSEYEYLDACDYLNFMYHNNVLDKTELEGIVNEIKEKLDMDIFLVKYVIIDKDNDNDVYIDTGYSYKNTPLCLARDINIGSTHGKWYRIFHPEDAIDSALS